MSNILSKFKNFLAPEDEDEYEDVEEMETEREPEPVHKQVVHPTPVPTQPKVVSLGQAARMELLNFTMLSYDMTGDICAYIKNKKPIIVNMEKLASHEMQRAVDFLTGACCALNGSVEKVTDNIFIFAPEHVNVNPEKLKQRNVFPPTI